VFPRHCPGAAHVDAEVKRAQIYSVMAAVRLRATLELTLAALALPAGADIVETGAYLGGCTGLMLRALKAFDGCARRVWVFDSFEGLPAPDADADLGAAPFFEPVHPDFAVAGALASPEAAFWATLGRLGHDARAPADAARLVVVRGFFNETLAAARVGAVGLLHISQIANERVANVSDHLKEGQSVRVKVLEADEKGRLRLSMKAAAADAPVA
jgi:hypothetical protein